MTSRCTTPLLCGPAFFITHTAKKVGLIYSAGDFSAPITLFNRVLLTVLVLCRFVLSE